MQEQQRSKLDPKSKQCTFVGYEKGVKWYKLWDPVAQKVIVNKDVIVNEGHKLNLKGEEADKEIEAHADKYTVQVETDITQGPNGEDDASTSSQEDTSGSDNRIQKPTTLATGREKRTQKTPVRYDLEDMVSFALTVGSGDPSYF